MASYQGRRSQRLLFVLVAVLLVSCVCGDDTALFGPERSAKKKVLSLGVGCPEFFDRFSQAPEQNSTPFGSFAVTKGGGYAHVQLHLIKLWLPVGSSMILRSVEAADKPDVLVNLTDEYPSGVLHEDVIAPSVLAKEFRIELYRDRAHSAAGATSGERVEKVDEGHCFGFAIDYYFYALADTSVNIIPTTESICAKDNSKEAVCYYDDTATRTAFLASMAVARLQIQDANKVTKSCTGWLLGNSGHLITNHHCIKDENEAATVIVEMMAQATECSSSSNCQTYGGCAGARPAVTVQFKYTSSSLDYTIVQLVAAAADLKQYGYLRLQNSEGTVGQQIYIPQHPLYYGKRISLTDDFTTYVNILSTSASGCDATGYSYSGDTQGGSSGSPILDAKKHSVVALHYCTQFCANTGIPATKIIADLTTNANAIGGQPSVFDMVDNGQGGNEANFGTYTPIVKSSGKPTSRLKYDGAIQLSPDNSSVGIDHVTFGLQNDGDVILDVVSVEIDDNGHYSDVNHDCKATYIDATIYLFADGSSSSLQFNRDRNSKADPDDGSISFRDPYMKTYLKKGKYMVAIAPMGTTEAEAYAGVRTVKNPSDIEIYSCKDKGTYGSYMFQLFSTSELADQPVLPATVTINPGACSTPAASICSS